MTATVSRFEPRVAPCRHVSAGEQFVTEDQQGLITEDLPLRLRVPGAPRRSSTTAASTTRIVHHNGKVLVDEEFRGE